MSIAPLSTGSLAGIGQIDLSSMDIETALMMVQSQRVTMLDSQLKQQIDEVQKRNELTSQLNEMQAALNKLKAELKSDAKPGDKIPDNGDMKAIALDYARIAASLGMSTDPVGATVVVKPDGTQEVALNKEWRPDKAGLEQGLNDLKSQLDTASNSQQMDMLRLQSMSNKRNEAFDVMTNFIKKMQDSRSSIIGNMR